MGKSILGCAAALLLFACEARVDPFATPPIGAVMRIKPSLIDGMPSALDQRKGLAAAEPTRATLIYLTSKKKDVDGAADTSDDVTAIVVSDSRGERASWNWQSLERGAESSSSPSPSPSPSSSSSSSDSYSHCRHSEPDMIELLAEFGGMVLICDSTLVDAMDAAKIITFTTRSGAIKSFTSWGTTNAELGSGRAIVIHSFPI